MADYEIVHHADIHCYWCGHECGQVSSKTPINQVGTPVAYLLELLMLWSDQSRIVTFGVAGVLGMMSGSAAMALATRTFRWEGFASVEDLVNHMAGGVLMGFGGVTALGCTIGQGLTGISTLALGSGLALAGIVAGLDTGPVYGKLVEPIRASDTAGQLLGRLAVAGARLLVDVLDGIDSGALVAVQQSNDDLARRLALRIPIL